MTDRPEPQPASPAQTAMMTAASERITTAAIREAEAIFPDEVSRSVCADSILMEAYVRRQASLAAGNPQIDYIAGMVGYGVANMIRRIAAENPIPPKKDQN